MNFRYDINGLRAIAVIAVVLFHFNPAWVPGGFAGVDVFFVISGFLMTGIIFRGLEDDNFNLFKFYVARANRIIPALAVLCLALLVFGWFYLTPLDYKALGKHVASSMGFLSNVVYWRESGYFDAASHEKWLLHTWSLSVEWQFYIIYPIVLVVLKRFLSLENLKRLIVIGTLLGFAFSVIATMKWPNPAYYLLPTRAWEMMMGGVAFLYPWNVSETKKKLLEAIGLLLILVSYAFVTSDILWPGHFALIPVLGSYLMIVANQQSSLVTNNKVFQSLGKWSYSIYLWHWPVVVLGYYFDFQYWYLYGLPLSLTLGIISFLLVESIRFKSVYDWREIFKVKPVYMVIFIGVISSAIFIYYNKLFKEMTQFDMASQGGHGFCFTPSGSRSSVGNERNLNCFIHEGKFGKRVLSIGSSFMGHYEPFVKKIAIMEDITVQSLTTGSCFPSFTRSDHWPDGNERIAQCIMNRKYAEAHIDDYDTFIMSTRWDEFFINNEDYSDETFAMIEQILSRGKKVIFLPVPKVYEENIGNHFKNSILADEEFNITDFKVDTKKETYNILKSEELKRRFSDEKNFIYIEREWLFPKEHFMFEGRLTPYSSDGGHISVVGAEKAYQNIMENGIYLEKLKPYLP
jgi:peptidoglycan/LPS O-acetylase OafA/YrhL